MVLLIVGIILFVGLVIVHELGHFFAARRNGVDVEEFGIGFPPKVWGKKMKGGWLFSINLLPLGGFVRLKGESDSAEGEGTFGAASLWGKTQIMVAGVLMNLITAFLLLVALAWLGMPKLIDNQFTVSSDTTVIKPAKIAARTIEKGSPAEQAGLKQSDHILAIGPEGKQSKLTAPGDLSELTKQYAGKKVLLTYEREGRVEQTTVRLLSRQQVEESAKQGPAKGYLGVTPYLAGIGLERSTWSAPVVAAGLIKQFTVLTFQGLGKALKGVGSIVAGAVTGNSEARRDGQKQASSQVSGPVGIFAILKNGSNLGYQFVLFIIAIISLSLAIMNILPIPALDGGRLWLTLGARAFGTKLSKEKEELINGIGFLVLLLLIALITFVDIKRFF